MTQPGDPRPASSALTLGERVAEQLRRKITQGEFGPGQRLSEQALSDDLAISRNTLREVFRVLTKDGLLRHVPNRGVFVAVPSIASIIDIYRVRRLIECQALAQAYPRHPAKKRMRDAFEEALRCRTVEDWPGVGTANMAFHMAVVELADSERLNLLFAQVLAELRLAFGMLQDAEFLHAPFVDKNLAILELAEAGQFDRAAALLGDYLIHSERLVLAVYARRMADGSIGEL
ncbi:GntR family transcriptional regulator [Labrys sp. ZIDIC5]|uniref:GntR family transcriptional regulator n=1 Tax=Labrys sedimenti TaxID=3106036 RepID=UPI002ACA6BED|nr:GntR family transcriptional regulator [Labrys sp. ZIDIC5]MDZ5449663.1 GntR family transcriptional regulator [Labrys sp. ZIDIC5]